MNEIDIFKVLSNETRLSILEWLKEPAKHFPLQVHLLKDTEFEGWVCVGSICNKAAIAQSTVSHYLDILLRAGLLLETKWYEKWTYYRRNEHTIQKFAEYIKNKI